MFDKFIFKGYDSIRMSLNLTFNSSDSDVKFVRDLLTQAGRQNVNVRDRDILYVFHRDTIYTDYSNITDVAGVWEVTDISQSGTNYASGATIYPDDQKIVLASGSKLPSGTTRAIVTYATQDGLSDSQIDKNIDIAKNYLIMEMYEDTINYSGASTYEKMAKHLMITIATYYSLLAMNNSNAIQSGFNYRLDEYEIQTKLWGEGMIAETLLKAYWDRIQQMMSALQFYQSKQDAPLYIVNREGRSKPYNQDSSIFDSGLVQYGKTQLYSSTSRHAIILQEVNR